MTRAFCSENAVWFHACAFSPVEHSVPYRLLTIVLCQVQGSEARSRAPGSVQRLKQDMFAQIVFRYAFGVTQPARIQLRCFYTVPTLTSRYTVCPPRNASALVFRVSRSQRPSCLYVTRFASSSVAVVFSSDAAIHSPDPLS
jgi:hypothetical protein